ncbi:MAG: HD domain-containing protein [Candidatus Eisenbacteria bacterium]
MQPVATARSFLQRFHSLLENTAHLLGVQLEVWSDAERPLASHRPSPACLGCAERQPATFSACQRERRARAATAMDRNEAGAWQCSEGLELAVQPIAHYEAASGALLSIQERGGADTTTTEPSPAEVRRHAFLADLARLLSDQMYVLHEYTQLHGELDSRYDELNMLYGISGRLANYEDMRSSLRQLCAQARETLAADVALLWIPERRLTEVLPRDGCSLAASGGSKEWQQLLKNLGEAMIEEGPSEFTGALGSLPGLRGTALARVPIVVTRVAVQGASVGVLALLRLEQPESFRLSDQKLLRSVAEQVAMAVSNCELYEDLQNFLMATVKSLVNAIEAKDSYTSGHSERVNLISMLIAKAMGMDEEALETVRWASILHDVGKIGMPECILNKPDRLNAEEQEIMRRHPDRGYKVLAPIRQLSTPAVSVRAHHERWDGRGYPLGLSGREIPQVARIIAVADAFDAITTTRPYREARSFEYATRQILAVRGSQLDPEVVDVFLTLIPFLEEHHEMIHATAESLSAEKVT